MQDSLEVSVLLEVREVVSVFLVVSFLTLMSCSFLVRPGLMPTDFGSEQMCVDTIQNLQANALVNSSH